MHRIKNTLRSILKYKTASVFTVLSLVTAFLCIIIIALYVSFERSYDTFHVNNESIYRVEINQSNGIPAVVADVISENTPEVAEVSAIWNRGRSKLATIEMESNNEFIVGNALYAEGGFLRMFSFPLLEGDETNALEEAGSIVISESLNKKLFGDRRAYGEFLYLGKRQLKVTGIMKEFPSNSTIQADCIIAFETITKDNGGEKSYTKSWSEWSFDVFIQAQKGVDVKSLIKKISQIDVFDKTLEEIKERTPDREPLTLRPLNDLHYATNSWSKANKVVLNVLSLLSVLILIMGFVNFINFSTSQASRRAKSLSVQRVLGDKKLGSRFQIMLESVLLSLTSIIVAIIIHALIYSEIESLFEIQGLSVGTQALFMAWCLLFAIVFGVLASLYPSRYITSAPVSEVVKGNAFFTGKGKLFRNSLIVVQFVFTIGLIISALTIEKQLHFWRNYDIGIDKEHVVYLRTTGELRKHDQALADELMKNKNITDYTYSQFIPGNVGMGWGRKIDGQYVQIKCWPVDNRFIDFFKISIHEGRAFSKESMVDKNRFVLNRKAVEEFGWENPLERKMGGFNFTGDIIGVAENFNFSRLQDEIMPMQFWLTETRKNVLMLRLTKGGYVGAIQYIKDTARNFDSVNRIDVKFLDDEMNQLYAKEENVARLIEFVAAWCVLLALFGLLGLSVFICHDKTKEIGIRKVNGAKTIQVIAMLNIDFLKWVSLAFVIACPISWYFMDSWLQNFAYKTELSWWIFALAGLLAMAIAQLTVSIQSYRAATRNPVESLRSE